MVQSSYDLLIFKLDRFTKKFYLNKLIRGILICSSFILFSYLFLSVTEYWAYLKPTGKIILTGSFLVSALVGTIVLIGTPLLHLLKIGKTISHEQAAKIIGEHFSDVQDKLLNILQLKSQSERNSLDLIEASINQKSEEIKLVPFTKAINLSENKKYLRYVLPALLTLFILLFKFPNVLKESNQRLTTPTTFYEKPAPFKFEVNDLPNSIIQYESLTINLETIGNALPEETTIYINGQPFMMRKEDVGKFSYTLDRIKEDATLVFEAGKFKSKPYSVEVLPKPLLSNFKVTLDYPNYIGKKNTTISDIGDLNIPQGTNVTWEISGISAEKIDFKMGSELIETKRIDKNQFLYEKLILSNTNYTIYASNKFVKKADSLTFTIGVLKDEYPSISAIESIDSINQNFHFFSGKAYDDYGFSRLSFVVEKYHSNNTLDTVFVQPMSLRKNSLTTAFTHFINLSEYTLNPGDRLNYYFEIADNDAINGAKKSRSEIFQYSKPSLREFENQETEIKNDIKENLDKSLKDVDLLSEEIENLKERLISKEKMDWEDKKAVESLMEQHQELKNELEQVQKNLSKSRDLQKEFKTVDEEILKKQEQLEKMMDELLTDEMKEMMQKLEELLKEFEDQKAFENLEELEMDKTALENELDRMLELFKQLEFEQKMTETIEQLEKLAEEQKQLSQETAREESNPETLKKKQEELNEKFDDLKDDLSKLDEMNKELKDKLDMEESKEQSEQIDEMMEESQEQLEQKQKDKASQNQKKTGQKMSELAQAMSSMMQSASAEQQMENLEHLRQLLENLVALSFDQESLIEKIQETETSNPLYTELVQKQFKLKEDGMMIQDSLIALSKRVFQLESFITEEVYKVNRGMDQSIDHLQERRKGDANVSQQYTMTSVNNLALMLSETMEQMQAAMSKSMAGSQNCQKPGGSSPNPSLKKMQDALNKQMQEMMEGMQQQGKEKGESGKEGRQLSKDFAEMAQQQAAIREALRKMKEGMSQEEKNKSGVDDLMKAMDQTETDLVNKRLTEEMIKRQEEIFEQLLDFETAEQEREKEEQRESETANQISKQIPPALEEYLKQRQSEIDQFKTIPPDLEPFYKQLVEKYYELLN